MTVPDQNAENIFALHFVLSMTNSVRINTYRVGVILRDTNLSNRFARTAGGSFHD
jgi:hypothetical protein